tara:strand:- start:243 stop:785 length:543 start_codon:yes stop_codon:yes gene_type:complete
MRIIAGRLKSRALMYPKNKEFRPTQDKVKESLFNIIQDKIEGAIVWDLCCGTGGLGLEAYSRGAKEVFMVDKKCQTAKKNIQQLKLENESNIHLIQSDLCRFLKQVTSKPDIIIIDPPWKSLQLYQNALNSIFEFDILKPHTIIICEHHKKNDEMPWPDKTKIQQYQYGSSVLSIYKNNE